MEAVKSLPEQRVLLRNVSWETYERLVAEREERRVPRLFYDRGVLEIVSPSAAHEAVSRVVADLVGELALEFGIDVFGTGSTTFGREDLGRGFEPDQSFYFSGNAGRVRELVRRNGDINLAEGDPPPDLVFEADITSSSLDKLPIYARIGVPEVWRYAGGQPRILELRGEGYEATGASTVLSPLTADELARFVEEGLTLSHFDWVRGVREWARAPGHEGRP